MTPEAPEDQNACQIKIGSHVYGWNHGEVETLPAYYDRTEFVPKDPNDQETKRFIEQLNTIKRLKLAQGGLRHKNMVINISGIEVWVEGNDIARNATVTMSTQHAHFGPDKAKDGRTDTFAHTSSTSRGDQYIQLEFSTPFDLRKLDYIKINNRRDCCGYRTHNLILWLFGEKGEYHTTLQAINVDQVFRKSDFKLSGIGKDFLQKTEQKRTKDFQHYRLHDSDWNTTGTKGRFKIGNDDIDILETQGDCKDVLWMYSDHGVGQRDGFTKDPNGNTFEKFKTSSDGTLVPINPGYNKLNDWQYYPAHGHFMNQISHLWAKPVPTDKYNDDMDVHGLIRSGHATIWRDTGGDDKKQPSALYYGQDGRFMEQDPTTTLACATKHHNPHTECSGGKVVGEPCPGGKMHWLNSQKVRCFYETPREIQTLKNALRSTRSNDPRLRMYENIKSKFCSDPNNLEKTIEGKKCKVWGDAEDLTRKFCSENNYNRLKNGDNACTRTGMPNEDLFETIASEFCNANPNDSWCKCYNQVTDVCETKPDAAGCKEVDDEIDEILEDLPADGSGLLAKNEVKARRHCWARVCSNDQDAFVPRERKDCSLDVCIQSLQVGGHLAQSDVKMKCDIKPTTDDKQMQEYRDSTGRQGPGNTPSDRIKKWGKKWMLGSGIGVTSSSMLLSLCCVLILMMSGDPSTLE